MDLPIYSDESESHSESAAEVEPVSVTINLKTTTPHIQPVEGRKRENNKGDIKREQISLTKKHWLWIDNQPVLYMQSSPCRFYYNVIYHSHSFIFIIIIMKKSQQCKAGREWYTPYQSEDPSPTIPTYRQKEEKGNESRRL